jgi:predicted RNA binding protein YcfA (HicA-like mRNA interferase family)
LRLPRDVSGSALAQLLRRHGYEITRQTGSHLRLTSRIKGPEHHISIPAHKQLKIGTLAAVLGHPAVEVSSQNECQSGIIRSGCAVKHNGNDQDEPWATEPVPGGILRNLQGPT